MECQYIDSNLLDEYVSVRYCAPTVGNSTESAKAIVGLSTVTESCSDVLAKLTGVMAVLDWENVLLKTILSRVIENTVAMIFKLIEYLKFEFFELLGISMSP